MQNENLPTEELKNSVLSMKIYHSQKLNADDIQKFLKDILSLRTTTKTGYFSTH